MSNPTVYPQSKKQVFSECVECVSGNAQRDNQVPSELNGLKTILDDLEKILEALEQRLSSVLRPAMPTTECEECKPEVPGCPLGNNLGANRQLAERCARTVRDIADRLEI